MTLWVIKEGSDGELERQCLEKSIITIGWDELNDLSAINSKEELASKYTKIWANKSTHAVAANVSQIFAFVKTAKKGDLVVLPLKTTHKIAVGEISGGYEFDSSLKPWGFHKRSVRWIRKDISRDLFDQDLLFSFGSFRTFSKAERNNAEVRVKSVLEEGKGQADAKEVREDETEITKVFPDVEQISKDQILDFISRKFRGHDFAYLIAAIIKAKGFTVKVSPPGRDGGVDILASPGAFSFGEPRICIQVKSEDAPLSAEVYRELKGVMRDYRATHGILVSFGGFKNSIIQENKNDHFDIRLWNTNNVINELLTNYNNLDTETKSKLQLKQVWALIPDTEE